MTSKLEFVKIKDKGVEVATVEGLVEIKSCRELAPLFLKHNILGFTDVFKTLAKLSTLDSECLNYLSREFGEKHFLTILAKILRSKGENILEEIAKLEDKVFANGLEKVLVTGENIVVHGLSNSVALEEIVKNKPKVYIPEFRPYLIQAKLVAKKLAENGVNVTVITDNMVGYFMWKGEISAFLTEGIVLNNELVGRTGTLTYAISSFYSKVPAYCISYSIVQNTYTIDVPIAENNDVKYLSNKLITHRKAKTLYTHYDIVSLKYFRENMFIKVI